MTLTFAKLIAFFVGILNSIVWLVGTVAVLIFLYGVVRYIYKPEKKDRRKFMLTSLIVLFVMFSIWGILRLACNTLGNVCTGNPGNGVVCEYGTCNNQFLNNTGGLY